MQAVLLFLLFPGILWARSLVLVSYFDPFGGAQFNNSERSASELARKFKDHPEIDLRLCKLNTVFDKSFAQLEKCYKELEREPKLVLGLGEADCRGTKLEILARNKDLTFGPDNEGIERKGTPILESGPEAIGFTYPLKDMYCALSPWQRVQVTISNNAGSFTCNNIAYQFSVKYPAAVFGFIHLPAHNCRSLVRIRETVQTNLETMLLAAVRSEGPLLRFPTTKREFDQLREDNRSNRCEVEFFKKTKGTDE